MLWQMTALNALKGSRKVLTAQTVCHWKRHAHTKHDIRLSMHQMIKKISKLQLPDYERTLKNSSQQIYLNADETLRTLLILLTRRLKRMYSLPYITMMNPHMAKIWNAYLYSYRDLMSFISQCKGEEGGEVEQNVNYHDILEFQIVNEEDNRQFVKVLENVMDMHTDNIVDLRDGIKESKRSDNYVDDALFEMCGLSEKDFLDEHLKERILMRLIANNHILLTNNKAGDGNSGMLEKDLNVVDILERSIGFVADMTTLKYYEKIEVDLDIIKIDSTGNTTISRGVTFDGQKKGKLIFPYIGNHIEYVLNELLKNSARAVIENKVQKPVKILLVLNNSKSVPVLQIKISDLGGGIRPDVIGKLWEYSFTTAKDKKSRTSVQLASSGRDVQLGAVDDLGINEQQADNLVGDNIIAGMGYGLPLSLTYCRLFGGDIRLHTVWGKGTDVHVIFKGI